MKTEFNVGDTIEITEVGEASKHFFSVGDIGKIIECCDTGHYHVDFNNQNNKKVRAHGKWFISNTLAITYGAYALFKLYQEKPRFHNAQVGDLLWNDDYGVCRVEKITSRTQYPIHISSKIITDEEITLEGKRFISSPVPTFFYYSPENHYLTERPEPDIDWSKASGAKVKVCDLIIDKEPEDMIFAFYTPELKYPYWVYDVNREDIVYGYKYCSLAEPCKPEWRK